MRISLIICTYMRPESLRKLLISVEKQVITPYEIIIVDSSTKKDTSIMLEDQNYNLNIKYYLVSDEYRGLTKQRNYGIKKASFDIDLIAFLDDDILLEKNYFKELVNTFIYYPDAIGVGGVTTNEVSWQKNTKKRDSHYFVFDGWERKEDLRYVIRKKLSLVPNLQPALNAGYGNERSVGFLPPSDKIYYVDFFMGGIASYKKEVFQKISFSNFFEGYGLYEDKDFTLKCSKLGKLYVNTNAKCEHHHDPLGRPNFYKYGKMVIWNGWRVWRVSNPNPKLLESIKWWIISILLSYLRLGHVIKSKRKKDAFLDFLGRKVSLLKLIYSKPRLD